MEVKCKCKKCNVQKDPFEETECDGCKKNFNWQRSTAHENDFDSDLIKLCNYCESEGPIYIDKNSNENAFIRDKSPATPDKRVLRNGKIIRSGIPIITKSKSQCANSNVNHRRRVLKDANENNKVSQVSKMIGDIEKSVNKLRDRFLTMEERIIELESNANANNLNGNVDIDEDHKINEKIEALSNTIKCCETLLQSNIIHNQQIAKEFKETGHKINNEISIRIDESRRIKYIEHEFKNIKEQLDEMKWQMEWQINSIGLQSTRIGENAFVCKSPKKKKAGQHHLNVSSNSDANKETTTKTQDDTKCITVHNKSSLHCHRSSNASKSGKDEAATKETSPARATNVIAHNKSSTHRFAQHANGDTYTRQIKAVLHDTHIVSLNTIVTEIGKRFETSIGNNIVDNVIVTKYTLSGNVINKIEVIIRFKVPLSHQYIDNFRFPTNWTFIRYFSNMHRVNTYNTTGNNIRSSYRNGGSLNY